MAMYTRFAIRYDGWFRILATALGIGPGVSRVEVGPDGLRVRMGWAFQARIDRAAITGAAPYTGAIGGIGVHGLGGVYLVNGSTRGLVRIDLTTTRRHQARCTGFPVKLLTLIVSLEDPEGFQEALGF